MIPLDEDELDEAGAIADEYATPGALAGLQVQGPWSQQPGAMPSTNPAQTRFPPGGLPLPPRAQEVGARLDAGDAAGVEHDMDAPPPPPPPPRPMPSPPPMRRPTMPSFGGPMPGHIADARAMAAGADEGAPPPPVQRAKVAPPEEQGGRLDDGLYSEGSIAGQQVADRVGGFLRALGGSQQGRSNRGDQMQQSRMQGLAQRESDKRADVQRQVARDDEMTQRESATGLRNRQMDLQQAQFAATQERQGRQDSIAERRASSQERLSELNAGLATARTDRERIAYRRQIEDETPGNERARAAARAYTMVARSRERDSGVPEAQRRAPEAIMAELDGLSASQIERAQRQIPWMTMGSRTRAANGAGGGQLRTAPGQSLDQDSFRELYRERVGGTDQEADIVFNNPRARNAFVSDLGNIPERRQGRPSSATDDPSRRITGFQLREDAPALSVTEMRETRQVAASQGRLDGILSRMDELAGQISTMERAGASAGVLSEKVAEFTQLHEASINTLREIGHLGVPNGNEIARMEALSPQLTSARGVMSGRALYRGLRASQRRITDGWLHDYGYERAAGSPSGQPGRAPPQRPSGPQAAPRDVVRMRRPDGSLRNVPRDRAADAAEAGWEAVEQ